MAKYIKQFNGHSDYTLYKNDDIVLPNVSRCDSEDHVHYNPVELSDMPLTFDILSDGVIKWKSTDDSTSVRTIQYKKNSGEWTSITSSTTGAEIPVQKGDSVSFKGSNTTYGAITNGTPSTSSFNATCLFKAKGNLRSLVTLDDYDSSLTLEPFAFLMLFYQCDTLITADQLILNADTLGQASYMNMFDSCYNLKRGPKLADTVLAANCYQKMFASCYNLIEAPELPNTSLATACYRYMFDNCKALRKAPILPATTLASQCYQQMFNECESLIEAPVLPAMNLQENCYYQMFSGCTSLVNAPELPATTLANNCYQFMFYNCTNLVNGPSVLPAVALTANCYRSMFSGCTNLVTAPTINATTLADSCCYQMFINCSSLTTAPTLKASTLTTTCYRQMFANCTNLTSVTCFASDLSASNCTLNWLYSVSPTGTFEKRSDTTWTTGVSGIPENWTIVNNSGPWPEYEF